MTGYVLARYSFYGRKVILGILVATLFVLILLDAAFTVTFRVLGR